VGSNPTPSATDRPFALPNGRPTWMLTGRRYLPKLGPELEIRFRLAPCYRGPPRSAIVRAGHRYPNGRRGCISGQDGRQMVSRAEVAPHSLLREVSKRAKLRGRACGHRMRPQ
jgi:hypothetical protein